MTSDLQNFVDPRDVLRAHGLFAKKRFSQNFLTSEATVHRIAAAAGLRPDDVCVELGPGLGTLTRALLATSATVIGVEQDRDMIGVLESEFATSTNFRLVHGDAATIDLGELAAGVPGGRIVLVGNLPYAITGAIARNLVTHAAIVARAVVMIQREVQDRWLAPPGEKAYGAATVFLTASYEVQRVLLVPPGAFHPPPKVHSAVVRLTPHATPRAEETDAFRAVVKAAFGKRRKTLRNALRALAPTPEALDAALDEAGIDGKRRGETLTVEEFATLAGTAAHHGFAVGGAGS